jgi:hypothetical protein
MRSCPQVACSVPNDFPFFLQLDIFLQLNRDRELSCLPFATCVLCVRLFPHPLEAVFNWMQSPRLLCPTALPACGASRSCAVVFHIPYRRRFSRCGVSLFFAAQEPKHIRKTVFLCWRCPFVANWICCHRGSQHWLWLSYRERVRYR